jgi:hypothetical protein
LVEGFDEKEDLGGHGVVEVRGVGEGGVAAAVEDGLQGLDEGAERGGDVGDGGDLLEEGGGSGGTAILFRVLSQKEIPATWASRDGFQNLEFNRAFASTDRWFL